MKTSEIISKVRILHFLSDALMCDSLSFFSWVSVFPYVQELDLTRVDRKMWTWRLDALWDLCPELQLINIIEKNLP